SSDVCSSDLRAALDLVAVQACARVRRVLGQVVGVDHLDPAGGDEQGQEHREDHEAQSSQFLGHQPITTRGWRRTPSLMRSSSATMSQLATSEDPPAARNGVVRPVSGMTRVTPPTMMNTCSAIVKDRPVASSLPKSSCPARPMRSPRLTNTMYRQRMANSPTMPSSSPRLGLM